MLSRTRKPPVRVSDVMSAQCPIHHVRIVEDCVYCLGLVTTYDARARYMKARTTPEVKQMIKDQPMILEPAPPKPPPVDPMILLADLADKIDEKRRMFRVTALLTALSALLLLSGAAAMTVGLFLLPELILMGTPVTILGLFCVMNCHPVRAYLKIHGAKTEFAHAQRRVGL